MKLRLTLVLLSSPLMACATVDQPVRFTCRYRDLQLAPDVFRVSSRGNGSARQDRVVDWAHLRAAELALQQVIFG